MTTLKVKSGAGGTWEEVGGAGVGVPPGGTTGQVLTKASAADYATAWASNQPILSNASYLQGYKADGTTAQSLIGMTAADEISIGPSLAAGKQILVPRLTVQGALLVADNAWHGTPSQTNMLYYSTADGKFYLSPTQNLWINNGGAGETVFWRNVQINGTLYKYGGAAYTHPDFVFEHFYTGGITQYLGAHGATEYRGLPSLDAVEAHTRETLRLPGTRGEKYDLFARGDELLAEVERLYLHVFSLNRRVKELEAR